MKNEPEKTISQQACVPVLDSLLQELRSLIDHTRMAAAATVNASLTAMYWSVGKRINAEVLGGKRGEYGSEIVSTVSRQLESEYGRGFSAKNIRHMMRFAEVYPDTKTVSTLSRQLNWSHFKELIYLKQPLKRDFYVEMCRVEKWSVRMLRKKIDSMLYERTALSKKSDDVIEYELDQLRESGQMSPELIFKDPYFLDFLGLND